MVKPISLNKPLDHWIVELDNWFGSEEDRFPYEEWCHENACQSYIMASGFGRQIVFANKDDAYLCYLTFR